MTPWFARAGLPLADNERAGVDDLLRAAAPHALPAIAVLASWREAAVLVRATAHDTAWFDDEEDERERLWLRALETTTEADLAAQLDAALHGRDVELRAAAVAAATAAGVADADVVDEAVAMALLALHQHALAACAGADAAHRFHRKYALFAGGRWPVGVYGARFAIL